MFWCFIPDINQSVCQQLFWDWEKLNFLNKLVSRTFFYYEGQFCAWLVSLDCRLRLFEYFAGSFSKNETALSFFFLLLVPVQCLDMTFCTFSFALSRWRQPIFFQRVLFVSFQTRYGKLLWCKCFVRVLCKECHVFNLSCKTVWNGMT